MVTVLWNFDIAMKPLRVIEMSLKRNYEGVCFYVWWPMASIPLHHDIGKTSGCDKIQISRLNLIWGWLVTKMFDVDIMKSKNVGCVNIRET